MSFRLPPAPARFLAAAAAILCAVSQGALADDAEPRPGAEAPQAKGEVPQAKGEVPQAKGEVPQAKGEVLQETAIAPQRFQVVESESGPVSYYRVVDDPEPFIRAVYRPPLETATLGFEVPDDLRGRVRRVRWKWRAMTLPQGGDECRDGRGDSAAVVYLTFKRGLKWYSLKYVWSSEGPKGATCDRHNNLFRGQDTIVLESGGPTGVWVTEEVDPGAEFRRHWEGGDPNADVPDMVGIGIMSDGDQTNSVSAADYAGFTLLLSPRNR